MSDPWKRREVIGDATLYLGDCLEILPTLERVDAVITDPPYGIGFKYESSYEDVGGDAYMKMLEPLRGFPLALLQYPEEMMRYLVPVFGAPNECYAWCYNSNLSRQSRLWGFWGIDIDWYAVKQPAKNPTDKRLVEFFGNEQALVKSYDWCGDIQQIKNVSEEKSGHPCQLPVELLCRIILFSKAQIVMDPFMGSGTTGVACMNLGRKFIGIEIEPKYFDIAVERITNAQRQSSLLDPYESNQKSYEQVKLL